jgi:hypothetical protein
MSDNDKLAKEALKFKPVQTKKNKREKENWSHCVVIVMNFKQIVCFRSKMNHIL